jgi:hypothetical protein
MPPTSSTARGSSTTCQSPVDLVLVTGPGPYYARPLAEFEVDRPRRDIDAHLLPLQVTRNAGNNVRQGPETRSHRRQGWPQLGDGLLLISALTAQVSTEVQIFRRFNPRENIAGVLTLPRRPLETALC